MFEKTQLKATKLNCYAVNHRVILEARVHFHKGNFVSAATPEVRWLNCSHREFCGKRCDFFYPDDLCDIIIRSKNKEFLYIEEPFQD